MDDSGTGGTAKPRMRVYETWQGNERFFCHGFLVAGPNWKSGMGSVALLLAPTVVFLVLVAPYMAKMLSPVFLVISCVLPCICLLTLMMTACRDPGILPRQDPDPEWLAGRMPRTRDVEVNGHMVQVRYNDTCHFYQPPRAHHCSVNDNCIERFDHHCPWVGTTVGLRNYRTFLLFIYSTTVYITWTFGVSMGMLFVKHKELLGAAGGDENTAGNSIWLQTLGQCPGALALMIFTFIFFWFVGGLSGFHTYLVATNQTTYENFRYNHSQVPNPYDLGIVRNCLSVWCLKIPSSKVDFRAYLDEYVPQPINIHYPYQWEWPSKRRHPAAAAAPATGPVTARPPSAAAAYSPNRRPSAQAAPVNGQGSVSSDSSRGPTGAAAGGPMGGALYRQQEQQPEYGYQPLSQDPGAAAGPVRPSVFENGALQGPPGAPSAAERGSVAASGGALEPGNGMAGGSAVGRTPFATLPAAPALAPSPMYPPSAPYQQQQQRLGSGALQQQQSGVGAAESFTPGGMESPAPAARPLSPAVAGVTPSPGGSVQMVTQGRQSPGQRWGSETDGDLESGVQNGNRI